MTDQPHDLSIVVLPDDLDTLLHGPSITAEAWSPDDPHGMPAAIVRVSYDPHA